MSAMWWDLSLQALVFLVSGLMYLWMNDIPRNLLTKYYSYRDRSKHLARRHFVKSADFLNTARSHPPSSPLSLRAAAAAAEEADAAIKLDSSDAAYHIIKALALQIQGFSTSALDAVNVALSPVAVKSLSNEEKSDAMVRRAELRMEVSRVGGGDSVDESVLNVVELELKEAVGLWPKSGRGWWLLGECCEGLGKKDEAKKAFEEAIRVEPDSMVARKGLDRLGGDS